MVQRTNWNISNCNVQKDEEVLVHHDLNLIPSISEAHLPPTPRQIELCNHIEDVTGCEFNGLTRMDASKFIDEHLDECEYLESTGGERR